MKIESKEELSIFYGLMTLSVFYMAIIIYLHPTGINGLILSIVIVLPLAIVFRLLSNLWSSMRAKTIAYIWLIILVAIQLSIIIPVV